MCCKQIDQPYQNLNPSIVQDFSNYRNFEHQQYHLFSKILQKLQVFQYEIYLNAKNSHQYVEELIRLLQQKLNDEQKITINDQSSKLNYNLIFVEILKYFNFQIDKEDNLMNQIAIIDQLLLYFNFQIQSLAYYSLAYVNPIQQNLFMPQLQELLINYQSPYLQTLFPYAKNDQVLALANQYQLVSQSYSQIFQHQIAQIQQNNFNYMQLLATFLQLISNNIKQFKSLQFNIISQLIYQAIQSNQPRFIFIPNKSITHLRGIGNVLDSFSHEYMLLNLRNNQAMEKFFTLIYYLPSIYSLFNNLDGVVGQIISQNNSNIVIAIAKRNIPRKILSKSIKSLHNFHAVNAVMMNFYIITILEKVDDKLALKQSLLMNFLDWMDWLQFYLSYLMIFDDIYEAKINNDQDQTCCDPGEIDVS